MTVTVEFETVQEAQRILYLLHQDLARTEGSIVLAHQVIESADNGELVGAHKLERAHKTLASAPKQAAIVRSAQKAIKAGLDAHDQQRRVR